tara:strand:+ start:1795 stop:2505 length:711 start_codon:yes stop_codon:yes gene_type:complete
MGLPIQKATLYNTVLPISGQKVKYRPFLVKEQANMMVTRETDSTLEMFDSIVGLISSCTEGKVDATKLPMADLEYLFLQIRVKSVGESGSVPLVCRNAEDDCKEVHVEDVDLSLLNVDTSKLLDSQIQISDELMVELTPPTCQLAFEMDGKSESEVIRPLLRSCMVRIYDEENVYEMAEHRDSEIDEFIDSLTVSQFDKMSEYFMSMPTLKHSVQWTCKACKYENNVVLEGLQNFF